MYQFISIAYIIYLPMYLSSTCPSSIIYQSFIYQLIIYLYLSVCLLMCVYLPPICLSVCLFSIYSYIYHLSNLSSIYQLFKVCVFVCLSMHNFFRLTHIWYIETKPCLSDFYGHGHPDTTWPLAFCSPNQNPARSRVP